MKTEQDPIVIVATQRTPLGQFQGAFSSFSATKLGSIAIEAALKQSELPLESIDEVLMGCVLPAGLGQAPARQAALGAKLPESVGCTTVNKVCGSGMKSMMLAHDLLLAGNGKIIIAGGMESMTNAPYLLEKARQGYRLGHGTMVDHMFLDGLEDAYEKGTLMGVFAERCADKYQLTREMQDEYALRSVKRAQEAIAKGWFKKEIVPVSIAAKTGTTLLENDELPGKAMPEKIPKLKPAFKENGTVTPANSSAISDGAAAHILMRKSEAQRRNINPLATILAHTTYSQQPAWFTTAPIQAMQNLMEKVGWTVKDVDLFEINEAFAVVPMSAMQVLKLPIEKVNIHGGACVLGHPIGASGARIVTTLIYALKEHGLKRGIASLCIGGGEATAMAIEING